MTTKNKNNNAVVDRSMDIFFGNMSKDLDYYGKLMGETTQEAYLYDVDEENQKEIDDCYYTYRKMEEFYRKLSNKYLEKINEKPFFSYNIRSKTVDNLSKGIDDISPDSFPLIYGKVWHDFKCDMGDNLMILDELIREKEEENEEEMNI